MRNPHGPPSAPDRVLATLYRARWGVACDDVSSTFCMASREVLLDVLTTSLPVRYPQNFLRVAAELRGYAVRDVDVLYEPRRAGTSALEARPGRVFAQKLVDFLRAAFREDRRAEENELTAYLALHAPQTAPRPLGRLERIWQALYFFCAPLHKWMITRRAGGMLAALRRFQYLAPADIREFQAQKLRKLVRHAYNHVPYYRRTLDAAGVKPEDIRTLDDLERLPLLSKKDVRENLYFDMFSDNHDKSAILKIQTSGSTGEPFTLFVDRSQLEMRFATTLRGMEWAGWRWGDRQVRLWHQTLGMTAVQIFKEWLDAKFMRRDFVPAFELNREKIRATLDLLRRRRPAVVDGYAECFNLLARFASSEEGAGGFDGVRGILSSAQVLPEHVRARIEQTFRVPVFDKYGSREFSGIAYEDEGHDGHLVNAESYIVEVIKNGRPARPGEVGEVVITDLNNRCMPLIRYRIGDLAEAVDNTRPSRSGKGLPRLGKIQGRSQAVVLCANGVWLPGTFFAHFFKDYEHAVAHYQVVQETSRELVVNVVPGPLWSDAIERQLVAALGKYTGEHMAIRFSAVASIPLVRTGKRTAVVSKLDYDFQEIEQ